MSQQRIVVGPSSFLVNYPNQQLPMYIMQEERQLIIIIKREIGRYRDMERCGKMEEQREMGRDRGQR